MGKICSINALIQGIYGWGDGYYSNEAAEMYELFWTRYTPKGNTFKVGIHNGNFDKDIYLYGLYGGLNVHPMQITGILETSNSAESEMFQFQLRDLDSILKDLAEHMMSRANIKVSYKILYSVIDTPIELYDTQKYEYK